MLLKTSIGVSVFSLVLFSALAISGVKGPTFNVGGSAPGGRGASGGHGFWFGGK